MKTLCLLLFLITLLWCCSVPLIVRGYARMTADDIICGNRCPTEERINTCISVLTWFNEWITGRTDQDYLRIKRLSDMLDEMQNPQG